MCVNEPRPAPVFGIAQLRLAADERGTPEDFIILEIDAEFSRLTGWPREGFPRPASGLPGLTGSTHQYWLAICMGVLEAERTRETTQWMSSAERYLTVTVIPTGPGAITILLREGDEAAAALGGEDEAAQQLVGLESTFCSTHDAVSLIKYSDGEYRILRNNALHQKLTGISDMRGMELSKAAGEEAFVSLRGHFERAMATGRAVNYEQEFTFAPGKRVWQTNAQVIFSRPGAHYILCMSKDISELKRAERKSENLARRLHAMFNQHRAIMMIFEPDTGRILDVNPSACAFFGYTREEFLGLYVQDINALPVDLVEEERAISEGDGALFTALPHVLKNGEIRLLDIYSCPIIDDGRRFRYSIVFDATDRERFRSELVQEKELLRVTLQSIGDGVVTTDTEGKITGLNSVAEALTGWTSAQAQGHPFAEVFVLRSELTGKTVENPIQKVLETGKIVGLANHTELVNRSGAHIPIADSASPIKGTGGELLGVVMVFRDVTEEKAHARQIEYLSYHDALTDLYNRRGIERFFDWLCEEENLPVSVLMGDVDGLKLANDVFGHAAGDALLKNVATLLQERCDPSALIARWGGDEFVVFLPKTGLEEAEALIRSIRDTPVSVKKGELYLSLSLGCASRDRLDKSLRTALSEAEEYMYHQKLLAGKSYRNAILNTLLATLYEKSYETESHSVRLEQYCHAVGRELRLSSKEMDELSLLALLHDIGKVTVDPAILRKPAPLIPSEWEEMRRHPETGCRIAQASPELSMVADLILSHHERWDGMGYPRGLKGEEIPLLCRILSVADALDAMMSDRVYRPAIGLRAAIAELERCKGTQFDPLIADLIISILRDEAVLA